MGERDLGLCIDIGSSGVRCAAFSIMVKGKCGPNADGSPPTLVPETMVKYSLDFIGAQGIGQASKVITAVEECLDRCVAILREFGAFPKSLPNIFMFFIVMHVPVNPVSK